MLLVVGDVDAAARQMLSDFGLGSVAGGDHPRWGTGNRIVPVGSQYIELFGVIDPEVASTTPIGQWVTANVSQRGDFLGGVAIGTDDLNGIEGRLGIGSTVGTRVLANGNRVSWRIAGIEVALSERLPFFIEWDDPGLRLGFERSTEGIEAAAITRVDLGGDAARVRAWLGEDVRGVHLVGGEPGVRTAVIATATGEVVLREHPWEQAHGPH